MVRQDRALGPRWQHRLPLGRATIGGALAGLCAALAMLLFLMIQSAVAGLGLSLPLRLLAASTTGAVSDDAGAVALGLALQLVVGVLVGALFGATFGRLRSEAAGVVLGVVYGVLVWMVATFTVVPWLAPLLSGFVAMLPWGWLAAHVVYGAAVGLAPAFARLFARTTTTPFITEPRELPI